MRDESRNGLPSEVPLRKGAEGSALDLPFGEFPKRGHLRARLEPAEAGHGHEPPHLLGVAFTPEQGPDGPRREGS